MRAARGHGSVEQQTVGDKQSHEDPIVARLGTLRQCSDSGSYQKDLLRHWRGPSMPAHDPLLPFGSMGRSRAVTIIDLSTLLAQQCRHGTTKHGRCSAVPPERPAANGGMKDLSEDLAMT
jgi:hypothetical protein